MRRAIAVADIGGTNARFAIAEVEGNRVRSLGEAVTLKTDDYSSLDSAWAEFSRRSGGGLPDAIGIAFAGPVGGGELELTNSPWVIRPDQLGKRLGVTHYRIVNDFGAIAHAVAQLGPECFDHLCGPKEALPTTGLISIVGPGTGLGVAQLLLAADDYHILETEGGHIDFAPLDSLEDRILAHLRRSFRRVSVERIASGPGLANLYTALASIEGKAVELLDDRSLWAHALDGSDPLAVAALDRFFLSLGAIAGDYALAHGAEAVVVAGGLGHKLRDRFATSGFAERFIAKGRFERRMEAIPVKLVRHPQPGLFGAAAAFAKEFA